MEYPKPQVCIQSYLTLKIFTIYLHLISVYEAPQESSYEAPQSDSYEAPQSDSYEAPQSDSYEAPSSSQAPSYE